MFLNTIINIYILLLFDILFNIKKFGAAWWLFADTYIWDKRKNQFEGDMNSIVSYIPGILGTIGFFLYCIILLKDIS